ncbi:hypothetical protein V8F33_007420 [Rhypophila sp. PSN 637]
MGPVPPVVLFLPCPSTLNIHLAPGARLEMFVLTLHGDKGMGSLDRGLEAYTAIFMLVVGGGPSLWHLYVICGCYLGPHLAFHLRTLSCIKIVTQSILFYGHSCCRLFFFVYCGSGLCFLSTSSQVTRHD